MAPQQGAGSGPPSDDAATLTLEERPPASPALELDEIQAMLIRERPEPYFGTHVLVRVDDPNAGREFIRRLLPYVDSAATVGGDAWLGTGITYAGLEALGVPTESLQSFPETFRVGMAARAKQLGDVGLNAPENWDFPFGIGQIHIGVSAFSNSPERWRHTVAVAREQAIGFSGVTIIHTQDFGAQPGSLNPLGFRDLIGQPAIEGSPVEPLPGQGEPIKAGEFILGYPSEGGIPLPMPVPDVLGRNGTYVCVRKYQTRVGRFNRFLHEHGATPGEREWLAAKMFGRWRSGAPLTLSPDDDDPQLGMDPRRNNDFDYSGDLRGLQAPIGCHMRRLNPRDTKLAILTDVRIHRIIRRSTTYGAPYDPNALSVEDDEVPRGVYFIFLSAKAMDTLEFLQSEWMNNGNFTGLNNERDPIVGLQQEEAVFTIPQTPVRRRVHGIETFNVLRGGEYLFMPSISALDWIAQLP
jgi:deferrochelatase/peroxidase EfeB